MADDIKAGGISFDIEADVSPINRALDGLKQRLEGIFSGGGGNNKALKGLESELNKNMAAIDRLRAKKELLETTGDTTKLSSKYAKLSQQFETMTARADELRAIMAEAQAEDPLTGLFSPKYKDAQKELDALVPKLDAVAQAMYQMEDAGENEQMTSTYKKVLAQLDQLISKNGELEEQVAAVRDETLKGNIKAGLFGKLKEMFSGLGERVGRTAQEMKLGTKRVLMYALGVRTLFTAVQRLRTALSQGFGNLTKAGGETKQNMESLTASLNMLKNALASAFAPIFNYIAPALNTLIGGLSAAANAVARFMAALTGKGFATVATKSFEGIGDSAAAAGGAVGDLQRQLMGFDQINKLEDASGGGGGGGGGLNYDDMFDTVSVDDATSKFAEMVKQAWANADFTEVGLVVGRKINEALASINWDKIHETATKIAKSLATFLNGAIEGIDWALVGSTISNGLITLLDTVSTFVENVDWDAIPGKIIDFLQGVDWGGIASSLFELIGAALGGLGAFIGGFISEAIQRAKDYFGSKVEECGGDVVAGILKGIWDAIKGIGLWIKKNIFDPFIKGFKKAFGIASPSKEMKKMGGFLIDGLLAGLKGLWDKAKGIFETFKSNMIAFFKDPIGSIKTKFEDTAASLADKWNSITSGVKDKTPSVTAKFQTKSEITSAWENATSGLSDVVKNITGNVTKLINSAGAIDVVARVTSIAGNIVGLITDAINNALNGLFNAPSANRAPVLTNASVPSNVAGGGALPMANDESRTVELLTQILAWLNSYDRDIYLDGQSIKDRVVRLINNNTLSTGVCEIRV